MSLPSLLLFPTRPTSRRAAAALWEDVIAPAYAAAGAKPEPVWA